MFYEYGPPTMLIYPKMVSFRHSYLFLLDDTKRERPRNRSLNDWNLIIIKVFPLPKGRPYCISSAYYYYYYYFSFFFSADREQKVP